MHGLETCPQHIGFEAFADVNKDLEKRSSWSTWVGSKSNDKCPSTAEDRQQEAT